MTIYFNKDNESIAISKRKLEILCQHYKQIANALTSNEVQKVLKDWQGKTYNERLETALKKIDKHFSVDRQFGCYLEYNFYNHAERSFNIEVKNYYGELEKRNIYINTYKHTVKQLTKSSILEDRLTICEDIAAQIIEVAKYYQAQYEKLNNQLFDLDNILKEYKEVINKANEFTDKVQSDIKQEFKMILINQS